MNNINLLFTYCCVIAVVLSSCSDTNTTDDLSKHEDEFHEEVINTDLNKKDSKTIEISHPLEASKSLENSGIAYNKRLMHSLTKVTNYSTAFKQGINLGIYMADATYATVYDQTQDAMSYLAISKRLASNLGIDEAIDKNMMQKYETYLDNKDTLANLMNRSYVNADAYLRANHRVDIASLVLAGGLIESLHLSTQLYSDSLEIANKQELLSEVDKQKTSIDQLINMLSEYKEDNSIVALIEQFEELKIIYNALDRKTPKVGHIKSKVEAIRETVI